MMTSEQKVNPGEMRPSGVRTIDARQNCAYLTEIEIERRLQSDNDDCESADSCLSRGWSPLLQRRSHLPVFVLSERAARLRPYVPLRCRRHRELYDHLVIRCFGNCHGVIRAGNEVKRFQLGTGRAETLLCRIEPLRPVLDRFNALLREADERDVGRHGYPPIHGGPAPLVLTIEEVSACRFLW